MFECAKWIGEIPTNNSLGAALNITIVVSAQISFIHIRNIYTQLETICFTILISRFNWIVFIAAATI